ncbi:MAG: amino acid permease, partial [Planctomycetales bacterium]|nr:amino acid permease [Planctomycetales bacterium]
MVEVTREGAAGASPCDGAEFSGWDVVALVVGIVVGTGVFKAPSLIFAETAGLSGAVWMWGLGGLLSFCGGLTYAELASSHPANGGDYLYLSHAYGRRWGFLFGWSQLAVIFSGSIAAMAFAFGDYASRCVSTDDRWALGLAFLAIASSSWVNLWGVALGRRSQNLLTIAKVVGLALVALAGLWISVRNAGTQVVAAEGLDASVRAGGNLGLALVFVLYAFGGWNDAVYVAGEVRDVQRTLPRALFGGIAAVTAIYLAIVCAIWAALGPELARTSHAPAADVVGRAIGPLGSKLVSALIAVSALGAINGMVITGARVYGALGQRHARLAWLRPRDDRGHAPTTAVIAQSLVAAGYVWLVGTQACRDGLNRALAVVRLPEIPWDSYFGGFETLVAATAPVVWFFFCLSGAASIVIRLRGETTPNSFRMPWFPVPAAAFTAASAYMLYSSAL